MNRVVSVMIALLCLSDPVFAQSDQRWGGAIGVYGDSNGFSCEIQPEPSGIFRFYLFHLASPGTLGSEFKLDLTGFAYSIWLGQESPLHWMGYFHQGISIQYGTCLTGTIYLGVTTFLGRGAPPTCLRVYVKKHPVPSIPGATTPIAFGCPSGLWLMSGSYAIVSEYFMNCPCPGTIATEESSWGRIKILYE